MRLYGVQLVAGLTERGFDGVEASFQSVDARGLPGDERFGRGLPGFVAFAEEANDRPGDTRDTRDDADDDFSGHYAPPRFAPGHGR